MNKTIVSSLTRLSSPRTYAPPAGFAVARFAGFAGGWRGWRGWRGNLFDNSRTDLFDKLFYNKFFYELHSNELSTRGEESIMHDKLFFSKLFFCKFYIEGGSIMGRNTPGSK